MVRLKDLFAVGLSSLYDEQRDPVLIISSNGKFQQVALTRVHERKSRDKLSSQFERPQVIQRPHQSFFQYSCNETSLELDTLRNKPQLQFTTAGTSSR